MHVLCLCAFQEALFYLLQIVCFSKVPDVCYSSHGRLTHVGHLIETKCNLWQTTKASNAHKHNTMHVNQS